MASLPPHLSYLPSFHNVISIPSHLGRGGLVPFAGTAKEIVDTVEDARRIGWEKSLKKHGLHLALSAAGDVVGGGFGVYKLSAKGARVIRSARAARTGNDFVDVIRSAEDVGAPTQGRPIVPAGQGNPFAGGVPPNLRTPFHWSDAQLQAAADSISHAAFGANGVTGVPISVTVTPSGRVIVSQARQVPSVAARARAREIFGENVEFVRGTTGSNAPGLRGGDAEARAIHFLGDEARGARQATTHYACPECEARQNAAGVINVTGTQSQHGQITRPIGGN
jgi:hypothetical protein